MISQITVIVIYLGGKIKTKKTTVRATPLQLINLKLEILLKQGRKKRHNLLWVYYDDA